MKKTSPKSFYEKVVVSDTLSEQEIKRHGELQDKGMKWLFNKGYIAISEFTLPNGKRVDCIGYNKNGHIIIIEVKASIADFRQDQKWETYLNYCNEFYFLLDFPIKYEEVNETGFLIENKSSLEVIKESPMYNNLNSSDKMNLMYSINKNLSRKYIFGY